MGLKIEKVQFQKIRPTYLAALIPTAVAINFAGVAIRQYLGVPLFLDSGGTFLATFIGGPWIGFLVAVLQAVATALLINPTLILTFLATGVYAIMIGYAAKYSITRSWLGLILTLIVTIPIASVVSSYVYTYAFGGFTGTSYDILAAVLVKASGELFTGIFLKDLITGFLDKIVIVAIVMAILRVLPAQFRYLTPLKAESDDSSDL
ncbi:MAG: hypothetical protein Q8878_05305 [Bacillota bacterium]|nr:hypothetical protein [Bacillota bacterium]